MRRRWIVLLVAAVCVLSGCGIPDNTPVSVVGAGRQRGASAGDYLADTRPLRTATTDKQQFVNNYLAAASGDVDSAIEQVKEFMSPELKPKFKPQQNIQVIRLVGQPLVNPGIPLVRVTARMVGTLNNVGALTPAEDTSNHYFDLSVAAVDGQSGLFITNAPPLLLLSDTALDLYFRPRTIYFWNTDNSGLIPDVRYLPQSLPKAQQPSEVMTWLTSGPSDWLGGKGGVANSLPTGTKLIDNVPAISDDRLRISLSSQALPANDTAGALDRLQKQLRWSLRPNLAGTLDLAVEHQPEHEYKDNADYLSSNAAYRPSEPERFVLYDGQIHRLARSYNASAPLPVVQPAANRNVQAAAFSATANRQYAALIVTDGNAKQSLRVGSAKSGTQAPLTPLSGLPAELGPARPVWAPAQPAAIQDTTFGLVIAKGQLYSFTPAGGRARRVSWPGGLAAVTAVAIAPDARRIALLSGGRLYVTTVSNDNGVQLGTPILLTTVLTGLTAVDWGAEGTLVVAGTNQETRRVAIMDVSVDGAVQRNRLGDRGANPITSLTAYPANPARDEPGVPVAYVLNDAAYDESNTERIDLKDLAPPLPAARPGVQPPTAPFFLG